MTRGKQKQDCKENKYNKIPERKRKDKARKDQGRKWKEAREVWYAKDEESPKTRFFRQRIEEIIITKDRT